MATNGRPWPFPRHKDTTEEHQERAGKAHEPSEPESTQPIEPDDGQDEPGED